MSMGESFCPSLDSCIACRADSYNSQWVLHFYLSASTGDVYPNQLDIHWQIPLNELSATTSSWMFALSVEDKYNLAQNTRCPLTPHHKRSSSTASHSFNKASPSKHHLSSQNNYQNWCSSRPVRLTRSFGTEWVCLERTAGHTASWSGGAGWKVLERSRAPSDTRSGSDGTHPCAAGASTPSPAPAAALASRPDIKKTVPWLWPADDTRRGGAVVRGRCFAIVLEF